MSDWDQIFVKMVVYLQRNEREKTLNLTNPKVLIHHLPYSSVSPADAQNYSKA